jgi:DNA topoisomerase-1
LSSNDYIIIIAEKPDAAKRIAAAIGDGGDFRKKFEGNLLYFEIKRHGRRILVIPASGHLYTIGQFRGGRSYYPVYTFRWIPKFKVEKKAYRTRQIIQMFESLSKDASELINATDYDVEGSLIGYTILKYACYGREKDAKRMQFSALTKDDLDYAYENLLPHLDFEFVEAGRSRHEVDWLYGINLSRALTISALKNSKKYTTLSVGRVQGPALKLVVQREIEIRNFVPIPFWKIKAFVKIKGEVYEVKFEKDNLESKLNAEEVATKCSGETGIVTTVDERQLQRSPLEPLNLGALQKESYRFFGYTPRRTLNIAEKLYLNALISYPRTSSQKLPKTIGYRNILNGLLKIPKYGKFAELILMQGELEPNEGNNTDSAHPAIYPTGKSPEGMLSSEESKIYDLVVRRFLVAFSSPTVRLTTTISIECKNYIFLLHGSRILDEGWTVFYKPYTGSDEAILPPLKSGDAIQFKDVTASMHFTDPPPRYNPASMLRDMEKHNLGTKATRADIIDTLLERGYVRGEHMVATDLGFAVIEVLNRHCPSIVSLDFTRQLEEKMEKIEKKIDNRKDVLHDAVQKLNLALNQLNLMENEVGETLSKSIRSDSSKRSVIGACPECKTGELTILRSRKTGKRFIGCSNFFFGKCKKTLPLPQTGTVTPTEKICARCGYPIVMLKWSKKRPFRFCVNIDCPSKAAYKRKNNSDKVESRFEM